MSTTTMPTPTGRRTRAVVEARQGCDADRHDTASAYADYRCRCKPARTANAERVRRSRDAARELARTEAARRTAQTAGTSDPLLETVKPTPGLHFTADPARACAPRADINPDAFHSEGVEDQRWVARTYCDQCPVKTACGTWAVRTGQRHGVWGGMTSVELNRAVATYGTARAQAPQ